MQAERARMRVANSYVPCMAHRLEQRPTGACREALCPAMCVSIFSNCTSLHISSVMRVTWEGEGCIREGNVADRGHIYPYRCS